MTLTNRLRLAALTRAERGGRVVGTYVIDEDGVIDLRALEDRAPGSRASDPAPLGEIAGRFGDSGDVSDLYDDEEPRNRRWFARRREGSPSPEAIAAPEPRPAGPADFDLPPEIAPDPAAGTPLADTTRETVVSEAEADSVGADTEPAVDVTADRADTIDLRDRAELSSLQSAIREFNALPPLPSAEAEPGKARRSLFGARTARDDSPPSITDAGAAGDATEATVTDVTVTDVTATEAAACPVCGGPASRDFANRFLEIDFYSCGRCFHMWHVAAPEPHA